MDTSNVHLPWSPKGGNSEELNLHTSNWYESTLLINICSSLGKTEMRTIINLMVTLSIMISRKCLNSILQDEAGNKKTEHADTSFLECFSTLKQGCGDKNGSLSIYYKALL